MSDDELEAVAEDAADLTDVATQAIRAEIARRGLDIKVQSTPPPAMDEATADVFDPSSLDLAVAYRVWDVAEARQLKGIFDAAGIPSFSGAGQFGERRRFKSSFQGGVDFNVRYVDQQRAVRAVSESLPPEPQPDQKEYVPRCPKCRSPEIVFQGLEGAQGSTSGSNFTWSCDACGHRWKDDGVEEEA